MRPKIGERHIQTGEHLELYPGEHAQVSEVDGKAVATVEPEPGFGAAVRRLRYRMIGQWLERFREWRRT